MTLLKRKSALWHGPAILLLDWVSGPLKTGASSVSPLKKKRGRIQPDSDACYLWEAWETGEWVGGSVGGIQLVPIVATVQLHLSQQRWDYFYKASDSAQTAASAENPA